MHMNGMHPTFRQNLTGAFTLVETVLAIGVVSFAMISILGLIPVGLTTFRSAINVSVESSIANALAGEAQRSDFSNLPDETSIYYFDEQGIRLDNVADSVFVAEVTHPEPLVTGSSADESGSRPIVAPGIPAWSVTIRIKSKMASDDVSSHSVIILEDR